MSENDYLMGWAAYGLAALGCWLVWFKLTRWMWRWLREPLWLLAAVVLFTPTLVEPGKDLYAPAVAITAMDVLLKVGNVAWQAVSDMVLYTLIGFALYLLFALVRWPLERHWRARRAEQQAEQASHDRRTLRERLREDHGIADEADDAPRFGAARDPQMRVEPRL